MRSSRSHPLDGDTYITYDRLVSRGLPSDQRLDIIQSTLQDEDGREILGRTNELIKATVMVMRKEIWNQQSDLLGGYPGNQEDVDTINYIDREIEALNHNPEIDLMEVIIGEISHELSLNKRLKSSSPHAATLFTASHASPHSEHSSSQERDSRHSNN
tara:strand:- start:586 stop:1059 length:474 start_codon:yes stop_codon:yes gene_type:complete